MEATHPAYLALEGHKPEVYWLDYDECEVNYNLHVLDLLDTAHLLMDTRRPYTGYIPRKDPTWANEGHPQGAVGAPGESGPRFSQGFLIDIDTTPPPGGRAMNVELLTKVRDQIRDHPEVHDQEHWWKIVSTEVPEGFEVQNPDSTWYTDAKETLPQCGTSMCVAGWAVHLAGLKPAPEDAFTSSFTEGIVITDVETVWNGDFEEHISDVAADLLGLDPDQADALFEPFWTHAEVLAMMDEAITSGTITPPDTDSDDYEDYDDEEDD
jgi:hypothetical protein